MPGPKRYNDGWCAKCGDAPRAPSHVYCARCRNEYQRTYKARRAKGSPGYKATQVAYVRKRLYGITEDRYTELWAQQGGVCAICLTEDGKKGLMVDHDHDTGKVRGLLCANCNGAIGMLRERAGLFERATAYLA